jgi:hypothetical protein
MRSPSPRSESGAGSAAAAIKNPASIKVDASTLIPQLQGVKAAGGTGGRGTAGEMAETGRFDRKVEDFCGSSAR